MLKIGRKLNVRARTEVKPQMDRVQLAPGARGKVLTAGSNLCKTHWISLKINRKLRENERKSMKIKENQ